jgi:hypothetical protein
LIPSSVVGFFYSGELFHSMYGHHCFYVSVFFVHVLSCIVFIRGPCHLLAKDQGGRGHLVVSVILYVVHRNFLHYRALACKCLVTMEV